MIPYGPIYGAGERGARRSPLGEPGDDPRLHVVKFDTPPVALVAPNGYVGDRPASTSVEDLRHYPTGRSERK